jgi:hypothetical protein
MHSVPCRGCNFVCFHEGAEIDDDQMNTIQSNESISAASSKEKQTFCIRKELISLLLSVSSCDNNRSVTPGIDWDQISATSSKRKHADTASPGVYDLDDEYSNTGMREFDM